MIVTELMVGFGRRWVGGKEERRAWSGGSKSTYHLELPTNGTANSQKAVDAFG